MSVRIYTIWKLIYAVKKGRIFEGGKSGVGLEIQWALPMQVQILLSAKSFC